VNFSKFLKLLKIRKKRFAIWGYVYIDSGFKKLQNERNWSTYDFIHSKIEE